ncbi:hypothetical protein, partial [uncultured Ruminococcus sp.]|uniref:hypothetical protein n=1 Tax=uncultured Ruminococcus sp. TaxID=165186 RepID=UPI00267014C8
SRGTKDSSALSGISSMRGGFSFGSSTEELAAVGLTEGLIPLSAYADIPLFKGDKRLLCPVGHLLYERRLFFWLLYRGAGSRRLDGGVNPPVSLR